MRHALGLVGLTLVTATLSVVAGGACSQADSGAESSTGALSGNGAGNDKRAHDAGCVTCADPTYADGGSDSPSAPDYADAGAHFDLVIVSASVPETNQDGYAWDDDGITVSPPDPRITVTLQYSDGKTSEGSTSEQDDTTEPKYDETVIRGATYDGLSRATIKIVDVDPIGADLVDSCTGDISELTDIQCGDSTVTIKIVPRD